jgi:hypothetical protein
MFEKGCMCSAGIALFAAAGRHSYEQSANLFRSPENRQKLLTPRRGGRVAAPDCFVRR